MKIVRNSIIPFNGCAAVNVFGILFVRKEVQRITAQMLNHEKIHTAQMRELGYLPFYLLYFFEWLIRSLGRSNAYRNISFEREAYENEADLQYLSSRRRWAMWQ